ncbi:MAG: DNA polymerase III subunit delta [Pseudomonadales bacterium]|nr:DNA polymerase III subunit delta [Pseudomonadales bacterium]
MKINIRQLSKHLTEAPAPVYVVASDEPLLQQEACDQIRAALRSKGYTERDLFFVEGRFDWEEVLFSANSMSLFAEQKILEIRMPNGKPGDQGAKALQAFASDPPEGTAMLLIVPWLDNRAQKAKWVQALEKAGVLVPIWPVEVQELPAWIGQRFKAAGLHATPDAINALTDRIEGNLLAAVQEIEMLKLLAPGNEISADLVISGVSDSSRFNVYSLIDAALDQNPARTLRILEGLQTENQPLLPLVGFVSRDLRMLAGIARQIAAGQRIEAVFRSQWMPDKKKALVGKCIRAHSAAELQFMLAELGRLDKYLKGMAEGSAWDVMTEVLLRLAGRPVLKAGLADLN